MKRVMKLMSFLLAVSVSFSALANTSTASTKAKRVDAKKVNVKCYVQLIGGGETISLWRVKSSLLKNLKQTITGQEIFVINMQKKATIYRAKECIREEDDFKDARIKAMDEAIPR